MTTPATTTPATVTTAMTAHPVQARRAGFLSDLATVATRALRAIPREIEVVIPALTIPVFFYMINIAALKKTAEAGGLVSDFKAFQLPVAIIFAVTGVSRASALVTDIQSGYFDRLLVTPVRRLALLIGMMLADLALVMALAVPVVALGLIVGVEFETGVLGMLAFIGLSGLWGLVFTGFPYAIALKTGNPAAVNTSFLLFFPFAFLTTSFLPKQALAGWMARVAEWNPVTYLLDGLRAIVTDGWDGARIGKALLAIAVVGLISMTLAFAALRGRIARK